MHFDPDFFKVKTIFGKDSGYPDDLDCKSFLLDMMLADGFISGDESEEEIDWALYVYMYLIGIIEPDFSQPEALDDDSAIPDDHGQSCNSCIYKPQTERSEMQAGP